MNAKEKLKNDIIVDMANYISKEVLPMLEIAVMKAVQNLDIRELETLPATIDNTNNYIIDLFMVKKAPKLSEKTVEYYMSTIKELIALINKPLTKMEQTDIEYYLYSKQKLGNGGTSLNNLKRNISAFFTWLRKSKLVADNPCDGIENYTAIQKPVEVLEADEVEKLKEACKDVRDRAILEFLRCTAMRRGEIPNVKIKDIDFSTGKLVIFGHKTSQYRTVMLDKVALQYIKEYLDQERRIYLPEEPLFTYKYGDNGLAEEGIYSVVKNIAKRSVIKKNVYPHLFRHSTATTIISRGGTEDQAGRYLGHAPKGVTGKHYIRYTDHDTIDIFNRFVKAI